jgi:hypothetical protein
MILDGKTLRGNNPNSLTLRGNNPKNIVVQSSDPAYHIYERVDNAQNPNHHFGTSPDHFVFDLNFRSHGRIEAAGDGRQDHTHR